MVFWLAAVTAVLSSLAVSSIACFCLRLLRSKLQSTYTPDKPPDKPPYVIIPILPGPPPVGPPTPIPHTLIPSPPPSPVIPQPGPPSPFVRRHSFFERNDTVLSRWEQEQRLLQDKVAEAKLCFLYRNNTLEIKIISVGNFHPVIQKREAWVRVRNLKDRCVSVAMVYSNVVGDLVGKEGITFNNLNETALYHTTLWFSLWSQDDTGAQREYGNFDLPCKTLVEWKDLHSGFVGTYDFLMSNVTQKGPCLKLDLKYSLQNEMIVVTINEIQGLGSPRSNTTVIPTKVYVKLTFRNTSTTVRTPAARAKTKQTRGSSPRFNQTFNFSALADELNNVSLVVEVKIKKMFAETIAAVKFGSTAPDRQKRHWRKMVDGLANEKGYTMVHPLELRRMKPRHRLW